MQQQGEGRAEIYTYESPHLVYAAGWSVRPDKPFRLALGSFIEDYANRVEIVQLDEARGVIRSNPAQGFQHPYPPTKVGFIPDKDGTRPDLVATTGDYLRIWRLNDEPNSMNPAVRLEKLLNNNKGGEFSAPLTSFDWNELDPRRIGTASIDTTCTVWDVERGLVDTQLIAHDKEVYDIAWGGVGIFASVSADGSVRVFDLRDKEHSTIIYESPQPSTPLLRLSWNKQDPRYIAAFAMDSSKVLVLDIRYPTLPVAQLQRHQANVNAVCWAPHSAVHLCSAGDDCQALIWDLALTGAMGGQQDGAAAAAAAGGLDPILAYNAGAEINQLQWSSAQPDWVAICFGNKAQILRV